MGGRRGRHAQPELSLRPPRPPPEPPAPAEHPAPPQHALSAAVLQLEGIELDVGAFARKLSSNEVFGVLSLRVSDLPGADVFARKSDGTLMTPAEQRAVMADPNFDPPASSLKQYLKTRGLKYSTGTKAELLAAARKSAEKEEVDGVWGLKDFDDGNY